MENFRPLSSDLGDLRELAEALGGVLQVLELTQLVPPTGELVRFSPKPPLHQQKKQTNK